MVGIFPSSICSSTEPKASTELGQIQIRKKDIARNDLVILDEFGYVPEDIERARLLFQVVSRCYEKRSMIFTTNIEFSKLETILGDDKLAEAMIDKIVHHGRLIEFDESSHRMDAALMLGRLMLKLARLPNCSNCACYFVH